MRQGLAASRAIGVELGRPYYLAALAEAQSKTGQTQEGLILLAEALAMVERTGERFWEAELYRLKGELSLQARPGRARQGQSKGQGPKPKGDTPPSALRTAHSEAEACFWKAIEIARQQQAKSLELRAVMSLVRLWQSQGKKEEARQMLAEVHNWFMEGFDTKDL